MPNRRPNVPSNRAVKKARRGSKRTSTRLPLQEKLEIKHKWNDTSIKVTKASLGREYGKSGNAIAKIIGNQASYEKQARMGVLLCSRRYVPEQWPYMEKGLLEWIQFIRAKGEVVNPAVLKRKPAN